MMYLDQQAPLWKASHLKRNSQSYEFLRKRGTSQAVLLRRPNPFGGSSSWLANKDDGKMLKVGSPLHLSDSTSF
jgi:hypothetical protein